MRKFNLLMAIYVFLPFIVFSQIESNDTIIEKQRSVSLDEVIIKATRANDKFPAAFQNILKSEIMEDNLGQDIPILLETTPSIVTTSDAGGGIGYTGLRIRGTDMTRINVTVNGIPYNDPESHEVYWVDLPDIASSLDNIQIQRGVGSSTNGAAAFGGSMNLQTTKLNLKPYAEYNGSIGSFIDKKDEISDFSFEEIKKLKKTKLDTYKSSLSFGSGAITSSKHEDEMWSFDGRISKIYSNGYIDRAFSDLKSFYLSGNYFINKSLFKLVIFSGAEKTYQAWYGVPVDSLKTNRTYNPYNYSNQTDNYQQDNYQLLFSSQLSQNLNLNAALHYTKGKGYYENYEDNKPFSEYGLQDFIIGSDTITKTNLINQKWLNNNFYGTTFSLNYDNHKKLTMNFGGSLNKYDGKHYGKIIWSEYSSNGNSDKNWYQNSAMKIDLNVFGKVTYTVIKKLYITVDLQGRYINYKIKGIKDDLEEITQNHYFNFFNPKTGLLLDINDKNVVYASIAVANREPNRNNYEDADASNSPHSERLYDIEAGYSLKHKILQLNINGYYMSYKDQLVMTGKINNYGAPIMVNLPNSYRTGVELILAIKPLKKLKFDANLTISRNIIKDFTEYTDLYDKDWNFTGQKSIKHNNTNLSFSPDIIASSRLCYSVSRHFDLCLISKYVGKQYIDNTSDNNNKIKPYLINNILLQYTINPGFVKEIGFHLMLNNILNAKYESNAWVYKYYLDNQYNKDLYYYPQAGINFLFGLNIKF